MAETRARPAREKQRFDQIVEANIWFWRQVAGYHIQNWDLITEWRLLMPSTQIRRHNAACPQDFDGAEDDEVCFGSNGQVAHMDQAHAEQEEAEKDALKCH